ncbi:MAG: hemerythrin domain-containing protein [Thermoleophilia bacterium]|nr:hemerythrin domain-containing protein [Thermoleophilia bacterium]
MRITDALLGEHAVIYSLLDKLARGEFATADEARGQAHALTAALESHAHLEDELLFEPLEGHIGAEAGPLAVMRLEHDEIEAVLARLREIDEPVEAKTAATRLASLARDHFAKEEHVLFPLAETALGEGELERLGAEWATRRIP